MRRTQDKKGVEMVEYNGSLFRVQIIGNIPEIKTYEVHLIRGAFLDEAFVATGNVDAVGNVTQDRFMENVRFVTVN